MNDLAVIEQILRSRQQFFEEIRDGFDLRPKVRSMLVSSFVFLAIYGAVLGSTHSPAQALSSAVKLPILFLVTLLVCVPTLYFFNILFGSDQSIAQNVALILTAIAVTAVLLVSFAPISIFFLLTTSQYQFFKLLNVAIFGISGVMGVVFLAQGMRVMRGSEAGETERRWVLRLWMFLYAFVGSQLAWTIRPFIGAPSMQFELFRQLGGNFYTNIFASLGEILGFFIVA
ncbi:MAG: actin-binding WH2 domain-containing protein [Ardenticatenaceae bacterium]|nr:actin-binding WH2 domain-containing protein [Ardenticatenaceae bacterium]MCB9445057.1 actin-binding WH2 domain-containing protein [Ardenticatenaceae bacterium]